MFDGTNGRLACHRGIITNFDTAVGYYKVRYEDSDTEEYDEEQIEMMRHKPNYTNIMQALSTTRHERVEAEYMNTQASFNIPTKFSNGYSKAIEWIEANQHRHQRRRRRHHRQQELQGWYGGSRQHLQGCTQW